MGGEPRLYLRYREESRGVTAARSLGHRYRGRDVRVPRAGAIVEALAWLGARSEAERLVALSRSLRRLTRPKGWIERHIDDFPPLFVLLDLFEQRERLLQSVTFYLATIGTEETVGELARLLERKDLDLSRYAARGFHRGRSAACDRLLLVPLLSDDPTARMHATVALIERFERARRPLWEAFRAGKGEVVALLAEQADVRNALRCRSLLDRSDRSGKMRCDGVFERLGVRGNPWRPPPRFLRAEARWLR